MEKKDVASEFFGSCARLGETLLLTTISSLDPAAVPLREPKPKAKQGQVSAQTTADLFAQRSRGHFMGLALQNGLGLIIRR